MQLPPLNAVRVFEVAGRHGTFLDAANELNVTPGAVSRQIKLLEEHLGAQLFVRFGRKTRLTSEARQLLDVVRESLSAIELESDRIRRLATNSPLHIWGSFYFMRLWLIPNLYDFHTRHPRQEVTIGTAMSSDPMPHSTDVAIRFGRGHWDGMDSYRLIGMHLVPICSPQYLRDRPPIRSATDLQGHTFLQSVTRPEDWRLWLATAGVPDLQMTNKLSFTNADIAHRSAIEGIGIALGRRGFIDSDINEGRLVIPIDLTASTPDGFYLLIRSRSGRSRKIKIFKDWILDHFAVPAT